MADNGSPVDDLVRDGIADIKAGDKAAGRGKLEAAVKIDQYNEQAWFWLASVVESTDERRVCLNNVLLINPQNQRAAQMLSRIEGHAPPPQASTSTDSFGFDDSGSASSGPNRQMLLIVGALVIVVMVAAIAFLALGSGGETPLPTAFVTDTPTATPDEAGTATAQASITPTATISPTPTPAQLGTAWTDTPVPTTTPTAEPLPPPPNSLPGRIIMQSGRVLGDNANQPIVVVAAGNPASRQVVSGPDQRGQLPAMASGSQQFVWAQYLPSSRRLSMQIQTFGVATSMDIGQIFENNPPLFEANYPDWQGDRIVFSAQAGESDSELWLLSPSGQNVLANPADLLPPIEGTSDEGPAPAPPAEASPLLRLTNDMANNLWGHFDPTGTAVVYVAEENGQTDLFVVNTNTLQILPLTQNGNALIESAPDWGPTGEVIFAASVEGSDASSIYIMPEDASQPPTMLFDYGLHDIQPRFSPDGRYIVFSTDRAGDWDVVIFDREANTYYGLETNPDTIDIANGWTE